MALDLLGVLVPFGRSMLLIVLIMIHEEHLGSMVVVQKLREPLENQNVTVQLVI